MQRTSPGEQNSLSELTGLDEKNEVYLDDKGGDRRTHLARRTKAGKPAVAEKATGNALCEGVQNPHSGEVIETEGVITGC